MTDFKTLEERYNDRITPQQGKRVLYADAKTKFAGGKPSTGKSDDPIIVRAPGESQSGLASEDRGKPFVSAPTDTERMKRYLTGPKGIKFLTKQQLLQTGNTFAATRVINPLFVLGNTTPFTHTRRSLRPFSVDQAAKSLGGLIGGRIGSAISFAGGIASSLGLGKQSNDITSLRKIGQLQQETYNKLAGTNKPGLGSLLKKIVTESPIGRTITGVTAKRSMGEVDDGWTESRPELKTYIPTLMKQIAEYQQRNRGVSNDEMDNITFLRYFDRSDRSAMNSKIQGIDLSKESPISIAGKREDRADNTYTPRYYITDSSNFMRENTGVTIPPQYANLPVKQNSDASNFVFDDPINVSFAIGNNNHVQFRAFINDLKLSATPEYKTYQYIGRIEKFVNYSGVQREANFRLGIIAFSRPELTMVWKRINYLTGMVFPYGFTRGILQPNIIRLTIGNVFSDQPGYISSLDTDFKDLSESWDIYDQGTLNLESENDNFRFPLIGNQVPIAATLTMRFVIIEKATKISTSPFFKITEDMEEFKQPLINSTSAPGAKTPVTVNNPTTTEQPVVTNQTDQPSATQQTPERTTESKPAEIPVGSRSIMERRSPEPVPPPRNSLAERYSPRNYDKDNPFGLPKSPFPRPVPPGASTIGPDYGMPGRIRLRNP